MVSPNVDRARSKLQSMTYRQLERLAEYHEFKFDMKGRSKISRKAMVSQLMGCDSVVYSLGCADE